LTVRRAWGRWEGSHFCGPKETYSLAYNNYHNVFENSIGTWSEERFDTTKVWVCNSGPTGQTQSSPDQPYGIFAIDGYTNGNNQANTKILGNIAYITSSDIYHAARLFMVSKINAFELANNVAYIEPGFHLDRKTFGLFGVDNDGTNLKARDLTGIGGQGFDINRIWLLRGLGGQNLVGHVDSPKDNIEEGETVGNVSSIFTSSSGAKVCKRYVNGVLTNEPLWPWPMDQRIKEAMIQSGHRSVTYGMANDTGYVTDAIEYMLGTIPNECRSDGNAASPPPASSPPAPSPVTTSTVSIDKTSYGFGEDIVVTADGGSSNVQEWVALYVASNPDSAWSFEVNWKYLNGTQSAPASPVGSPATVTFTAPSIPGTYNIRYFPQNGFDNRLAISSDFTLVSSLSPPPSPKNLRVVH